MKYIIAINDVHVASEICTVHLRSTSVDHGDHTKSGWWTAATYAYEDAELQLTKQLQSDRYLCVLCTICLSLYILCCAFRMIVFACGCCDDCMWAVSACSAVIRRVCVECRVYDPQNARNDEIREWCAHNRRCIGEFAIFLMSQSRSKIRPTADIRHQPVCCWHLYQTCIHLLAEKVDPDPLITEITYPLWVFVSISMTHQMPELQPIFCVMHQM